MCNHESKYCPRCKSLFECKVGDVVNCQCNTVKTSEATKEFLQSTLYNDCLCKMSYRNKPDGTVQAAACFPCTKRADDRGAALLF